MKKILIYVTLLFISGCNFSQSNPLGSGNTSTNTTVANNGCPTQAPPITKTDALDLANSSIDVSGALQPNTGKAYQFEGKSKHLLQLTLDNAQICSWIFDPKGDLMKLENSAELTMDGKYIVSLWNPQGRSTFNLTIGLKDKQVSKPVEIVSEPKDPVSPVQPPKKQPQHDITQSEALDIVKGWYNSKPNIFGSSYDRNLLAQYATGITYYKNAEKDGGGSIGWLERNGCYYTYDYSNVENVISFNNSGTRPSIKVTVSERRQLHGPQSAGCSNPSTLSRRDITYWFEKENDTWKIYDDNAIK